MARTNAGSIEQKKSASRFRAAGMSPLISVATAITDAPGRPASMPATWRTFDLIAPSTDTLSLLEPCLSYVDYFMPSMEEAALIAGRQNENDIADFFLERGAGCCVFKWGSRGSFRADRNERKRIPAFKVDVSDTTGCGDAYCAGFIAGLANGEDLDGACRLATASSGLVATGLGSDAGIVDLARTREFMQQLDQRGWYQLDADEHAEISEIFAADFCSDEEGQAYIRESFEQGYLMDPHTATCLKTCRAEAFKSQTNIIYSTAEWTKFAGVVDQAINRGSPQPDEAALQAIAATAGIDIPVSISALFDKPVAHPTVVDKQDIEAEILAFLEAGD